VAINFEIFGIPYVMHVGIASLCTWSSVLAMDDAAYNRFSSAMHVQYRASWKKRFGGPGIFSKQESGNPEW